MKRCLNCQEPIRRIGVTCEDTNFCCASCRETLRARYIKDINFHERETKRLNREYEKCFQNGMK